MQRQEGRQRRADFIKNTLSRETLQMVVTWQGYMCVHVPDGDNESMQTVAVSLCVELG